MNSTLFLICAAGVLIVAAIIALGIGGQPVPRDISTFGGASQAELRFARRASRLQWIGYACVGLAAAAIGATMFLRF